jgi:hypothetical protein
MQLTLAGDCFVLILYLVNIDVAPTAREWTPPCACDLFSHDSRSSIALHDPDQFIHSATASCVESLEFANSAVQCASNVTREHTR